jgi:hypothetical protein
LPEALSVNADGKRRYTVAQIAAEFGVEASLRALALRGRLT